MSTKLKSVMGLSVLAGAILPASNGLSIFADDGPNSSSSEANSSSVAAFPETDDGEKTNGSTATLKSVTTVNGNPLTKDMAIQAGDTVNFAIVTNAGNEGLMDLFKDTLPDGLKFDPSGPSALHAYIVNNDGSIGDEITTEGTIKVDRQTITWTPKDPTKYFFVGSTGQSNRILFTIGTVSQTSLKSDTILENNAWLSVTNPKSNENKTVTSKSRVHIPKKLQPSIQKSVSIDDGENWTDYAELESNDQTYLYRLLATIPVNTLDNKLIISDDLADIQGFSKDDVKIYEGVYNSKADLDSDKVKDVTDHFDIVDDDNALSATAHEDYVKSIRDSKQTLKFSVIINGVKLKTVSKEELDQYLQGGVAYVTNVSVMDTGEKTTSNKTRIKTPIKDPNGSISKTVSVDGGNSWVVSAPIKGKDAVYTYKLETTLTQNIKKLKKVVISDELRNGQTVKLENVKVSAPDGTDLTKKGKVATSQNKSGNNVITWTMNEDYLEELKKDGNVPTFIITLSDVTLSQASVDQIKDATDDKGRVDVENVGELLQTDDEDKTTSLKSSKVDVYYDPKNDPQPDEPTPDNPIETIKKVVEEVVEKAVEKPVEATKEVLANTGAAVKAHPVIAGLFGASFLGAIAYAIRAWKKR